MGSSEVADVARISRTIPEDRPGAAPLGNRSGARGFAPSSPACTGPALGRIARSNPAPRRSRFEASGAESTHTPMAASSFATRGGVSLSVPSKRSGASPRATSSPTSGSETCCPRSRPSSGNETRNSWPAPGLHFVRSSESERPEPRRMLLRQALELSATRHF